MAWTLTTSNAATAKSGVNVNTTLSVSNAAMGKWSDDSEGYVEIATGKTWVDSYSVLGTGVKQMLSDVTSSKIAMNLIAADTTGYLSREADALLNVNDDIVTKGINILRDMDSSVLKAPR